MMRVFVATVLLLASGLTSAGLPGADANGWYSWEIDNDDKTRIAVRLKDGELQNLRTSTDTCHWRLAGKSIDLGVVSADENFAWFRQFVDDRSRRQRVRHTALFGVVQSGNDAAFDYIERLVLRMQ